MRSASSPSRALSPKKASKTGSSARGEPIERRWTIRHDLVGPTVSGNIVLVFRHDQKNLSLARSSCQRVPGCGPVPGQEEDVRWHGTRHQVPVGPFESLSNHFVSHDERLATADANLISL